MYQLENYVSGQWIAGEGRGQVLFNAVTAEPIATTSTGGIDFAAALEYGRRIGNPSLRRMSFHERGLMLKALALHLRNHLHKFYTISYQTAPPRQIAG